MAAVFPNVGISITETKDRLSLPRPLVGQQTLQSCRDTRRLERFLVANDQLRKLGVSSTVFKFTKEKNCLCRLQAQHARTRCLYPFIQLQRAWISLTLLAARRTESPETKTPLALQASLAAACLSTVTLQVTPAEIPEDTGVEEMKTRFRAQGVKLAFMCSAGDGVDVLVLQLREAHSPTFLEPDLFGLLRFEETKGSSKRYEQPIPKFGYSKLMREKGGDEHQQRCACCV